jgi:hypothetical protein
MILYTKKKNILRCIANFVVSCINPPAGILLTAVNLKQTYDEAHGDQQIREFMLNPENIKVFQDAGILTKENIERDRMEMKKGVRP